MPSDDTTFEALRAALRSAELPPSVQERRISWLGGGRALGFARDDNGQLEIFLAGEPLEVRESSVREHLIHDTWQTAGGEPFTASRLRLHEDDHHDAIAATILLELLDKGYERDANNAFRETEPLIAMALDPARVENFALTGLAGELVALAALVRLQPAASEALLAAWQGWRRSSRDFQFGSTGVEVKTSTTSASRHHIQGWYQVECGVANDSSVETDLYLLSIGIRWLSAGAPGTSIEALVKEITSTLSVPQQRRFIRAVRGYCGMNFVLDEDGTAGQASIRRPFLVTYERLYDLQDERIRLPRSADFAHFPELISDSVNFDVELPERVRGDRNPVVGLSAALPALLAQFL